MAGSTNPRDPDLVRFDAAKEKRTRWLPLLDEAYEHCLPQYPRPSDTDPNPGEKRGSSIYDATAGQALDDRAAETHDQLFPAFMEWMDFAPAADIGDLSDEDQKALSAKFEEARGKFHGAIEASNFHIEMPLAIRDAYVSTGAITVDPGTPDNPLDFGAVNIGRLAVEEARDGVIRTVFRERKERLRELTDLWPRGDFPETLTTRAKSNPEDLIELLEAELWEPKAENTRYRVMVQGHGGANGWHDILKETLDAQRTICFRLDKAPGETIGRGPAIGTLPDIKTANKVVELVLKNASIAVTGIWQADDDGVLNPANIKLVPGAIIPKAVGSQGLSPLEAPGRFDVSELVLNDLRERIRSAIAGPDLPPTDQGVRTAYEIGERKAKRNAVETPRMLRLLNELYYPLSRRVLAILTHPSMAGSPFHIADIEIAGRKVVPRPISPMVRLRDQAEADTGMAAFATVAELMGEGIQRIVDVDATMRWFLQRRFFPAALLISADAAAKQEQQDAAVQGATQAGAALVEEMAKEVA